MGRFTDFKTGLALTTDNGLKKVGGEKEEKRTVFHQELAFVSTFLSSHSVQDNFL